MPDQQPDKLLKKLIPLLTMLSEGDTLDGEQQEQFEKLRTSRSCQRMLRSLAGKILRNPDRELHEFLNETQLLISSVLASDIQAFVAKKRASRDEEDDALNQQTAGEDWNDSWDILNDVKRDMLFVYCDEVYGDPLPEDPVLEGEEAFSVHRDQFQANQYFGDEAFEAGKGVHKTPNKRQHDAWLDRLQQADSSTLMANLQQVFGTRLPELHVELDQQNFPAVFRKLYDKICQCPSLRKKISLSMRMGIRRLHGIFANDDQSNSIEAYYQNAEAEEARRIALYIRKYRWTQSEIEENLACYFGLCLYRVFRFALRNAHNHSHRRDGDPGSKYRNALLSSLTDGFEGNRVRNRGKSLPFDPEPVRATTAGDPLEAKLQEDLQAERAKKRTQRNERVHGMLKRELTRHERKLRTLKIELQPILQKSQDRIRREESQCARRLTKKHIELAALMNVLMPEWERLLQQNKVPPKWADELNAIEKKSHSKKEKLKQQRNHEVQKKMSDFGEQQKPKLTATQVEDQLEALEEKLKRLMNEFNIPVRI